jgi:microcystin-dependent protein
MKLPSTPLPRRQFLARVLGALTGGALLGKAERAAAEDMPFIGEIRMFAGYYAPSGWMFCEGQLLPILDYENLFQLIGATYGGDGESTFALPDLRGRAPVHHGNPSTGTWFIGETRGSEQVYVSTFQLPAHTHAAGASSSPGTSASPVGMVPARDADGAPRFAGSPNSTLGSGALTTVGATQPHNNIQPYVGIHFIISLEGAFPSQV